MVDVKRSTRDDTSLKVNPRIAELEAEVASMHGNFAKMNAHYGDQADRIEELELENTRLKLRIKELESVIAEQCCLDPMLCGRDGYICLACELSGEEDE